MFLKSAISYQLSAVSRQRGFAIVSAIFLLVTLAALGAFMVTFFTTQHSAAAMDVMGSRAYQAARAGIEWGAYDVLRNGNCAASTTLPLAGDLTPFSVTVQCTLYPTAAPNSFSEGANTIRTYQVVATARYGTLGDADYVYRQLQATLSTCRDPAGQPC